jgi:hypothetical protein
MLQRTLTKDTPVIISVLRDVAHPGQSLVATLLYNLQITHLNPRHSEIWYLKFDSDWGPFLYVLLCQL